MSRGGARVWGNTHPAAQLTEKKVIRYRALVRAGKATVGEIAAKEGCSHGRISMAMRGETWAHLNDIAPPVPGRPRGPSVGATSVGKAAAKRSAAKRPVAKTSTRAKPAVAKRATGQKTGARKAGARKTVAKTAASKKTAVKKAGARKTTARTARR